MMDNELFRSEIHTFADSMYDEFNSYKKIIYEIVREFHRVCQKNKIIYYAAFGSLLGIIRDSMMVLPWDKDADFLLPIVEREKLHQALKQDLNENFFFMSHEANSDFRLLMLRIGKRGYSLDTFHVDVFYMIGAPDSTEEQMLLRTRIRQVIRKNEIKKHFSAKKIFDNINGRRHLNLTNLKYKLLSFFYDVDKEFNKLIKKYPWKSSNHYATIGDGAEIFPKHMFEPRKIITVDGCECFIPYEAEKMLLSRYGNYQKLFPIANRFEEFYSGYKDILTSMKNNKMSIDRQFIQ